MKDDVGTMANEAVIKKDNSLDKNLVDQQKILNVIMENKKSNERISGELKELKKMTNDMGKTVNEMKARISS